MLASVVSGGALNSTNSTPSSERDKAHLSVVSLVKESGYLDQKPTRLQTVSLELCPLPQSGYKWKSLPKTIFPATIDYSVRNDDSHCAGTIAGGRAIAPNRPVGSFQPVKWLTVGLISF